MKMTKLISIISFLWILILLPTAFAQHPTSTPQVLQSIGFVGFSAISSSNSAPTHTWTNAGGNNLASNGANWSGGITPQNGDNVVFDNTSSENCIWDIEIWDIDITLSSFSIHSGYSGSVVLSSNLATADIIIWTGGALGDNNASNGDNWSDGVVPKDGDKVVFNEASQKDCNWNLNITPSLFSVNSAYTGTVTLNNNFTIGGNLTVAGGTLYLNDKNLNVNGYILISPAGILDASLTTTPSIITVGGGLGK